LQKTHSKTLTQDNNLLKEKTMFLLNGNRLAEGTSFYDANGTQYPPQWLNQATEEQKLAIGITWVADPAPIDTRFYWDTDLPKALEDKLEEDGSTTKGLKTQFVAQVKQTAGSLLAQTDWYVIRKAERDVAIPTNVVTKRAAIVTEADRLETAITNAATVEALIEVLNAQNWGE
jgi:hypothetical protein